ncbi:dihydrolipoyl dehydrogenase [Ignatzschineria indica]|uniref:dihydrolipoyl dehydrogenase n=1 Tax=Ignatzschineria indica TaxID=472583 RepID=UPI0025787AC2|nr:dihydrolipoyl dehydrogenase [Ignatzschineria indica]MDM1545147.1 dihydrolipoyl dehydrogenase [Ignatzschineria indica]
MIIDLKLPDIGNFDSVDVIDISVNIGDHVEVDDTLLTLESDKASMDVPAEKAGIITEILVNVGDSVKEGDLFARLEVADADLSSTSAVKEKIVDSEASTGAEQEEKAALVDSSVIDADCDLVVIGGGPGGYSAAFRAADLGLKVVLVERYPTIGGVCLNVGCIPSKALLHVVDVMETAKSFADIGVTFAEPEVDIDKLRGFKESVIGKLTSGLAGMAKMRKVEIVQGFATFKNDRCLTVALDDGAEREIRFNKAIIAAGSSAVKLPFLPEDPRIIDSTGALELEDIPQKLLVIGGGIIGLEMATVYSTLGSEITIAEFADGLVPGADRDLVKVFEKYNKDRFHKVMLKTAVTGAVAKDEGIEVTFEGENAPETPLLFDKVLVAVGRKPNGLTLHAEKAGVNVDERGFISVDRQMRTNVSHIFAIGDIVGQPMLAHKAVHEGHVAAEVCVGEKRFFDAKFVPSVAYTDPEIAWAGLTETEAKAKGISYEVSVFPWAASGKAIANGRDEGFTKLLYDPESKIILGGAVVGIHAGDLIGEVCLAVEMGADSIDIGHTIHPHPTLIESVGMAAENILGACTDLPPIKKRK